MDFVLISYLGVFLAPLVLLLGELFKNDTKAEYVKKGHKWVPVLIWSTVSGVILGLISAFSVVNSEHLESQNLYLVPFAVGIVGYITVQSYITDMKVLMINRQVLRVAIVAMYMLTIYNLVSNENFKQNMVAVILFTILLFVIFIFINIGASDVRAMAVAIPYVVSFGGFSAIFMFVITLLAVALGMELRNQYRDRARMKKFKEDNAEAYKTMNRLLFYQLARKMIHSEKTEEQTATPVGPFMIAPFLIFLIIYPYMI